MNKLIKELKDDPINFISSKPINVIAKLIKHAADIYYNTGTAIISDELYDLLVETLEEKDPKHKVLKKIGAPVTAKNRVKLPYYMGSMDKIKPNTGKLEKWVKKYPGSYVYSDKLDGVSGLLTVTKGEMKLYTRGDGTVGTDIDAFIRVIPSLRLYDLPDIVVRGEFIISKKSFKKYAKEMSNPRNMVSGFINSKTIDTKIGKDVEFVAYELIKPRMIPSEQYKELKKMGFNTVHHKKITTLTEKKLSNILEKRRKEGDYEVDGIVVYSNNLHPRPKSGNPKYAFAYKDILSDQIANVKVLEVEWNVSKDGYIKPRLRLEPTKLSGVVITYVTGFNAKYIVDNKIGPGAVIKLVRSGEVIPHILDVITPSKSRNLLPDIPFVWSKSGVDIIYDKTHGDAELEEKILIKNLTYFFKKMGIKYIDSASITKMVDVGLNSIPKILSADVDDFLEVESFHMKSAKRAYNEIQKMIVDVPLDKLMAASNLFGHSIGQKKIKAILDVYPNVLTSKLGKDDLIEKIRNINGFEIKTAKQFVDGLFEFRKFIKKVPMIKYRKATRKIKTGKFSGENIVFSGFRNKEWQNVIENNGGKVTTSVSGNTTILVVKDKTATTSKIQKAKSLGKKVMNINEFAKKFGLKNSIII